VTHISALKEISDRSQTALHCLRIIERLGVYLKGAMLSSQVGSLKIKLFSACIGLYTRPFNNSANKFLFSLNFLGRNCLSYRGAYLIFKERGGASHLP
jgi:hypothetical protein